MLNRSILVCLSGVACIGLVAMLKPGPVYAVPVVTVEVRTHGAPDNVGNGELFSAPFLVIPNLSDSDYANADIGNGVEAFVLGLRSATQYVNRYGQPPELHGDVDGSGFQDFDDIPAFVDLLVGRISTAHLRAVTEPSMLGLLAFGGLVLLLRNKPESGYGLQDYGKDRR